MRNRGFTLTEILVAMGIFALGGSFIVALFITNARLSRQAMDYTRAAEVSRNVRTLVQKSLGRPLNIGGKNYYSYYDPNTSLSFLPDQFVEDEGGDTRVRQDGRVGGAANQNTVFFPLPDQPFDVGMLPDPNADADPGLEKMMITLPNNAYGPDGSRMQFLDGPPGAFRLIPDRLRTDGVIDGFDADDRIFYSYDFSIRRSLMRSGITSKDGQTKEPLEDLFVVHVRIYKGYDFPQSNAGVEVVNEPFYEWDFYVAAAR